jgi:hypothetical protein
MSVMVDVEEVRCRKIIDDGSQLGAPDPGVTNRVIATGTVIISSAPEMGRSYFGLVAAIGIRVTPTKALTKPL